jgi:iron complex transport system ATP-binding protein
VTRLQARGVRVVRGGAKVLRGVDLDVAPGGLCVVVGPNGAGKSTLLGALLGWIPIAGGEVRLDGDAPSVLGSRERARRVAWLPQQAAVREALPVVEVVAAARYRLDEPVSVRLAAARAALDEVGAGALAERSALAVSGGEAQRVALAALIAQQAGAWLLDEPANHLDPAVQHEVITLLLGAWRAGRTLLLVVHDLDLVAARVEHPAEVEVLGLRDGAEAFRCSLADPELPGRLSALYGVRVHGVEVDGRRRLVVA